MTIGYTSQKLLCDEGKKLEKKWDIAILEYRKIQTADKLKNIYLSMQNYFIHRRNCGECTVRWVKMEAKHE